MKQLNNYILEKLHLNKDINVNSHYKYYPQNKDELVDLIEKLTKNNKNADLNCIDVSNIKNLDSVFNGSDCKNIDISKWDVSNCVSMNCMFSWADWFNCDLSLWDVSNVKDMTGMFANCDSFTGKGLEEWKINKDVKTNDMFNNCPNLIKKPSWYHE